MLHTVINAQSGRTLLDGATEAQFDRWYDAHPYYRQPRGLEEINPALHYVERDDESVHYLVEVQD